MAEYRDAPAERYYVCNKGLVDLAEIVEMWELNSEWRAIYRTRHEASVFSLAAGEKVFAALLAYRRENR